MSNEVELDQHGEAGRQLSALLSAALAAAQAGAQVAAQRARQHSQQADQQTRQAEQQTREQQRQAQQAAAGAQRQLERQQRTEQAVRHRQWGLKPTAQWLHDNPLSAAAAWSSADVHRDEDPVAARHAEQWETIFKRDGIGVEDVRANAPAAVAAAEGREPESGTPAAGPTEVNGEFAAAEVATSAVVAGAVDVATAEALAHTRSALDDHKAEMTPAALDVFNRSEQARTSGDWDAMLAATRQTAGLPTTAERESVLTAVELRFGPPWDVTPAESGSQASPGGAPSTEPEQQWSAYADGAPAAALGGRGVSTPPNQVLAQARQTPDLAATASQAASRAVELVHANGLDR